LQRGRAMLWVRQLLASTVWYLERSLLLLLFQLQIILFYHCVQLNAALLSLWHNNEASCHTLSCRLPSKTNSVAQWRLVSSTRWSVAAKCIALRTHSTPRSQLLVQNRDFCLPHLHSQPPLGGGGGSRQSIAIPFGVANLEWLGYTMVKKMLKICLFVLTQFTNVTDRQTNTHTHTAWRQRPRLMLASRGKNDVICATGSVMTSDECRSLALIQCVKTL